MFEIRTNKNECRTLTIGINFISKIISNFGILNLAPQKMFELCHLPEIRFRPFFPFELFFNDGAFTPDNPSLQAIQK
jgi:hypothetical protein